MEGKEKDYISPSIGFFIMIVVGIISFYVRSDDLPRLFLFFALGAVMFTASYIGNSIKSLK